MSLRRITFWTVFWIAISLLFNAGIYVMMGPAKAMEFLAGYVIEKSLSIDNLFIFLMIFSYFGIESKYQRRVLNFGIAAAIVLRFVLIIVGITIVHEFHWILYIVGLTLVYSSSKIVFGKERKIDPSQSTMLKYVRKVIPITDQLHKEHFFVKIKGRLHATPLFVILILVESTDLIFAMDSIPAIFAVTTDTFIVYSSNILAILGLRSLYFFLERMQDLFIFVKHGVGAILFLAGLKLILPLFNMKIPTSLALILILVILVGSILLSIIVKKRQMMLLKNADKTNATA
ncbi:MAG: TerC/Alx family metal homeostasis membrane protein [Candidatus Zhuqueibacterota bacterium]